MPNFITEITRENTQAAFVSDLQLKWYAERDPRNTRLAGAYSWTKQKITNELPSVEALSRLREVFEFAEVPNRFLWQAIYGQGKSHLALTLANFFGRPAGSPEVEAVLQGLAYAQADVDSLRAFKEAKGQFMVVCLFGNEPYTLAQGIALGLEAALKDHPDTVNRDLGLWFGPAAKALAALTPEQRTKADAFLEPHQLSIAALEDDIISRRGQYRLECAQALEHAAYLPDFGGVLAPQHMIEHAGREFCGPGKPFAGLLVIFDEFGRFTEDYARKYDLLSQNLPLQGLMQGIVNLGKEQPLGAIVALTQFEPEAIAERAIVNTNGLNDLKKELGRFPAPERAFLVSPLEAVLGDFLQQDKEVWADILAKHPAEVEAIGAAVDMTRMLFPVRYKAWTDEQMQEKIGQRCFPLHPLTTALLCTMGLRETVSVRPSLGFVQEKFREYAPRPVLRPGGGFNLIHATELVEFFGEALAKDDAGWTRYQEALRTTGAEASQLKKDVLAAMFVQETANLAVSPSGLTSYVNIIAALSGYSKNEVETALRELHTDTRINYDAPRKAYLFWSLSQDGLTAHRLLATDTDKILRDPVDFARILRQRLADAEGKVPVVLGNRDDWSAPVYLVPRALWSRDYLKTLLRRYQLNHDQSGLDGQARHGYVIRPVGFTEDEVNWLRANAPADFEAVLKELDPVTPPPALLVLPQQPHAGLLRTLVQSHVLHYEWSPQTKRDLTEKALQELTKVAEEQRKVEVDKLRREERTLAEYRVPSLYQASVVASLNESPAPNAEKVLKICYDLAYNWHAPYVEDPIASNHYRADVLLTCNYLSRDKFGAEWVAATGGNSHGIATKLYERILGGHFPTSWGIIDPANRVSEPTHPRVQKAWELLDAAVPVGNPDKVSLRPVLLQLLNAPYGFDCYSLGLLFSAWYGRHQRTLRLYKGLSSDRLLLPELMPLGAKPTPTLDAIIGRLLGAQDVYAQREDIEDLNLHIGQVLRAWEAREELSYEAALNHSVELQDFVTDSTSAPDIREQVQQMLPRLREAIELADKHAQHLTESTQLLSTLTSATEDTVRQAVKLLKDVRKGTPLGVVQPANPAAADELVQKIIDRIRSLYATVCNIYVTEQQTNTLNKCKEGTDRLLKLQSHVSYLLTDIEPAKVAEALANIDIARKRLQNEEQDSSLLARFKEIEKLTNFADLRAAQKELGSLSLQSEKGKLAYQHAVSVVDARIIQYRETLAAACARAQYLPERESRTFDKATDYKKLAEEVVSKLAKTLQNLSPIYQDASPEAEQHEQAQKWCNQWLKILGDLEGHSEETPENTKELQNLLTKYDKLYQQANDNAAQQQIIQEAKQRLEQQFAVKVQAAISKLEELISRNDKGDLAADVDSDFQTAQSTVFMFLPKTEELHRKRLVTALRKRLETDEVEGITQKFKQISRPQQIKLVERLRSLLEQEQTVDLN